MRKLLLACATLFSTALVAVTYPPMYFGVLVQQPIIHGNGVCAWSGLFPTSSYSAERAFYHDNRVLCWGGLNQDKQTFTSDKAYFNYDNGVKAWGGLYQSKLTWTSDNAKFYHRNGLMVWGGLDQNAQTWTTENGKFFHENGQMAWNGLFNTPVYYSNGRVAWNGTAKATVYDEVGSYVGVADYVTIHLGSNNWLYVDTANQFILTLNLGTGINLLAKKNTVNLDVYNTIFDITNDF